MKQKLILIFVFIIISSVVLISLKFFGESFLFTKKIAGSSIQKNDFRPAEIPSKKESFTEPAFNAKAGILIDADSSYILFEKNANGKLPIASTTKMATALVVLEDYHDKLNDVVTITNKMTNVEPSVIQLRIGEKITVQNLLNGLLIMSGNDAAFSLAEYFGGKENFVSEMNGKVKTIGLNNTHYLDPAGLNDEGYSTAKDLATLAAYAFRNPDYARIVSTPEEDISSTDGRIVHKLTNSNRLIRPDEPLYYQNSIGGKTGFTYAAGHVLVSAAEQDGHKLIAVVLNTNEVTNSASAKESKKILEWGFNNWQW